MAQQQEQKKVLIAVKTYPTPAKRGIEVCCTAGVTEDGKWIRLYPVPFRLLDSDKRFKRYQWIELSVTRRRKDPRPESYEPDIDSIEIVDKIGPGKNWLVRRSILADLTSHCLCCVERQRELFGSPTLGFFRPHRIRRLKIEPDDPNWTPEQLASLQQQPLFGSAPKQQLEKIPFKFKYEFVCDHSSCTGHQLTCTDWEMLAACRDWRKRYKGEWEAKFRHRFEEEMINKYDTHFYVGNQLSHPNAWLVVGLFYPGRENQTRRLL